MYFQDPTCPNSEPYVAFIESNVGSTSFLIADMELREGDRMQYVAGTYYRGNTNYGQCLVGKISARGAFQSSYYLSTTSNARISECYALSIVPEFYQIVTVGKAKETKTAALIMLMDQDLTLLSIKVWSWSGDYPAGVTGQASIEQEARDVAVTADGSIYVAGNVKGGFTFSSSSTHCFILRVDENLNKINARSFGISGKTMSCNSIQATRNADYLYVGGIIKHSRSALFFAKMDILAWSIIGTSLESGSNNFGMRRIILENNKAFSGTDDQNTLYFCGFYYDGTYKGDMVYGHLTSSSLTSISLKLVFQYGSTASEFTHTSATQVSHSFGDCTLTDDNAYLVAVFSTNYEVAKINSLSTAVYYSTPTTANEPFTTAGVSSGICNEIDDPTLESYFITYSTTPVGGTSIIATSCESQMKTQLNNYISSYTSSMNSWHVCNHYVFNYHDIYCRVSKLQFGSCDTSSFAHNGGGVTGLYKYYNDISACGASGCLPSSCKSYKCGYSNCACNQVINPSCVMYTDCCQQCADFLTTYNYYQWWYTSLPTCADWQFRTQVYDTPAASIGTMSSFDPYIFCEQVTGTCYAGAAPTYNGLSYIQDKLYLVFEQDCQNDGNKYESLFIFRVDLQSSKYSASVSMSSIPDAAVYFGDKGGRTYGHTIAVDEYGYIYVQGQSSAGAFGGSGSRYSWIHLKTHWEMTHELQYDRRLTYYSDPTPGYMGKRFVRPKSFTGSSFAKLLYNSAGAYAAGTWSLLSHTIKGYPMNENTVDLFTGTDSTFKLHTYKSSSGDWISNTILWGLSHSRLAPIQPLRITKSAVSSRNYTISLPVVCITYEVNFDSSSGVNAKKVVWDTKYFTYTNPYSFSSGTRTNLGLTITGVNGHTLPTLPPSLYHLSGVLNSASSNEGIYYLDYRSSTHYVVAARSQYYKCDLAEYGYFMNDMNKESMRRFESSLRVKIIIDDPTVEPPQIKKNIDDIKPVVGYQYFFTLTSGTYFTNCDRFKARRSLYTTTSTSSGTSQTIKSHQLPYWVQFHEKNSSFVIYPESSSTDAHIEVACCNVIEQCITNTFYILPQNNKPISAISTLQEKYIIQLDGTVGETFTWRKTKYNFYDLDKAVTDTSNSLYDALAVTNRNLNHSVLMDFTVTLTYFSQVYNIGMLFGQGATGNYLSSLAAQSITYQFYDVYSTSTKSSGTLSVIINKMPTVTNAGKSYTFATIDPTLYNTNTTYFDSYFPFLKTEDKNDSITVDTSLWFSSTQTLVYSLNRSDDTSLPDWIRYSQTSGEMILEPPSQGSSELIQLKAKVQDSYQGYAQTYKSILLNTPPQARQMYKYLQVYQGKKFTCDILEIFTDNDNDALTYTFVKSTDEARLNKNNIYLNTPQHRLFGDPEFPALISMVSIRATDTHGYYADAYITIKVMDYRVKYRNGRDFQDFEILEQRYFTFTVQDDVFYVPEDTNPLVMFASTLSDQPLPSWLHFNPSSLTFYGQAPEFNEQTYKIRLRAMNQQSHDQIDSIIKISVIKLYQPKSRVELIQYDIEVQKNSWFEVSLPMLAFMYSEQNMNVTLSIESTEQLLKFNPDNRTIFGQANQDLGTYRVDITLRDDIGLETYLNLRVTIIPLQKPFYLIYLPHLVISTSIFLSLVMYFGYLIHWLRLSMDPKIRKAFKRQLQKRSRTRFSQYQDVRVEFIRSLTLFRPGSSLTSKQENDNSISISDQQDNYATKNPQKSEKPNEHSFSFFQNPERQEINDTEQKLINEQSTIMMTSRPLQNTQEALLLQDDNNEDGTDHNKNDIENLVIPLNSNHDIGRPFRIHSTQQQAHQNSFPNLNTNSSKLVTQNSNSQNHSSANTLIQNFRENLNQFASEKSKISNSQFSQQSETMKKKSLFAVQRTLEDDNDEGNNEKSDKYENRAEESGTLRNALDDEEEVLTKV